MSSCNQYIEAYAGILSTLHTRELIFDDYEEDMRDELSYDLCSETRKDLFELFAEAIRVLEDTESNEFKRTCEELEEKFYHGKSTC